MNAVNSSGVIPRACESMGTAFVPNSSLTAFSPVRSFWSRAIGAGFMAGRNPSLIRSNAGPTENRWFTATTTMNAAPTAATSRPAVLRCHACITNPPFRSGANAGLCSPANSGPGPRSCAPRIPRCRHTNSVIAS